jgi:plasmid stability protein
MCPGHEDKMREQNAGKKILIRMEEDLHRRLRIRCAKLDTTIQEFVVELLDRELSGERSAPRASVPTVKARREKER